jgi:hypothetical protein
MSGDGIWIVVFLGVLSSVSDDGIPGTIATGRNGCLFFI